jgi:serine protease AprX
MKTPALITWKGLKHTILLLLVSTTSCLFGQVSDYQYYYRVLFRDKGDNQIGNFTPEELLSERAITRREKAGITVPDIRDIPVYHDYINQISSLGFNIHCTSKWMNTALFKTHDLADINKLLNLSFVADVKIVKTPGKKSLYSKKLDLWIEQADLPAFDRPITMVNGYPLQSTGFDGQNILIAILDGGFTGAEQISSLNHLRIRDGITRTYDFVGNNEFVYNYSIHGTAVLSVLAGLIPERIQGTAPGADYLLIRTEDGDSEFPCEEDFWAAGAEYADSLGADIISSSLGYSLFDDPDLNYKQTDLDGNTSFVTRVADIAASKGILVVNSAGNERDDDWLQIICPADGDSVLAAGAVDGDNNISVFSSAGPSADGRIKPDNVTMGVSVPVQVSISSVSRANGTSFSCPVLSGMAASLMQAVPLALNTDIINAIHMSADRYSSPDSLYGYGVPDMVAALAYLQDIYIKIPDNETIVGPNPTCGTIEIVFRQPPGSLTVEIITMSGKVVYRKDNFDFAGRRLLISELQNREQGIYFIRLIKSNGTEVHKIIKLKN